MENVFAVFEGDKHEDYFVAIFSDESEAKKCADSKDSMFWTGRVVEEKIYSTFKEYFDEVNRKE